MKKKLNPGKPGRPACDISDFVYACISAELAAGSTLAEAARKGIKIVDHTATGMKFERHLKNKHLEKGFRDAERDRVAPWLSTEGGFKHGRPVFIGSPLLTPIGVAPPSKRKRGRPKTK